MTTFAGSGVAGYVDANKTDAAFKSPFGIAVNRNTGIIYVADYLNSVIRRITPKGIYFIQCIILFYVCVSGVVITLAGTASTRGDYNDGQGLSAKFNGPAGIAVDYRYNVYVADANNNYIRKISPTGYSQSYFIQLLKWN